MSVLDCRGLACPEPVLKVKEKLEQGISEFEVVVDNGVALNNVKRFVAGQGGEVTVESDDADEYRLQVRVLSGDAETVSSAVATNDSRVDTTLVCVLSADVMGRGNDELGWALLQTYVQTIPQLEVVPGKVLLYNGGVKLVTAESASVVVFEKLQEMGVEVLVCGTCLDFYRLKAALRVGNISNMYEIMSVMGGASKIISPF